MAVSVLFSRLKKFDSNGCNKTEYAPFSLADAGMVWTYPGHGEQTLGNGDPFEIRCVCGLSHVGRGDISFMGTI